MEIACPPHCPYLVSARSHPPAVVQRRQRRDAHFLLAVVDGLTPRQYQIFLPVIAAVRRARPGVFPALVDQDVVQAAAALAATHETADRGIIYEHQPTSGPAQRVANAITDALGELARDGRVPPPDRDIAAVLRQLERGAQQAEAALQEGAATFLDIVDRVLQDAGKGTADDDAPSTPRDRPTGSGLILP